jgi:hypothetical protein
VAQVAEGQQLLLSEGVAFQSVRTPSRRQHRDLYLLGAVATGCVRAQSRDLDIRVLVDNHHPSKAIKPVTPLDTLQRTDLYLGRGDIPQPAQSLLPDT